MCASEIACRLPSVLPSLPRPGTAFAIAAGLAFAGRSMTLAVSAIGVRQIDFGRAGWRAATRLRRRPSKFSVEEAGPGAGGPSGLDRAPIPDVPFKAGLHVNYGETVLRMKDGLPKLKDFPCGMEAGQRRALLSHGARGPLLLVPSKPR
jgi:hypothetical protein